MPRILVVGNVTLDIVNLVENYPREDDEVRASEQYRRRGGNGGNTAVVLSQLGDEVTFAGVLADEPDAQAIFEDFALYPIDLEPVYTVSRGKVPTSYVALSRVTGSRTIVHYRDLPEYPAEAFSRIDLRGFDGIHFEGRNLDQVKLMLDRVRREKPECLVSIEVEKPRSGIHELFSHADLLLFSRHFALRQGYREAAGFLQSIHGQAPLARLACGWGDEGAYAMDCDGRLLFTTAFAPPTVIDTYMRGEPLESALTEGARLAGRKCGQQGFAGLRNS
jgi:ketohexokinase